MIQELAKACKDFEGQLIHRSQVMSSPWLSGSVQELFFDERLELIGFCFKWANFSREEVG